MLAFFVLATVALASAAPSPDGATTVVPHHHPSVPYFIVASLDVNLCSAVPSDMTPQSPFETACSKHKPTDQVCICKKPTPEKLELLQKWLATEGKKPLPVNANGYIPRCGHCDKDNKWEPIHL